MEPGAESYAEELCSTMAYDLRHDLGGPRGLILGLSPSPLSGVPSRFRLVCPRLDLLGVYGYVTR